MSLWTPVSTYGRDLTTRAEFVVRAGDETPFLLMWHPSHEASPKPFDAQQALADTEQWWRQWSGRCTYDGPGRDQVVRSLITLKALTYAPTGGIVAAPTTSLPEKYRRRLEDFEEWMELAASDGTELNAAIAGLVDLALTIYSRTDTGPLRA